VFGIPSTTGITRLGITVTRAVGGAVVRNRAKRRLRDVFRRHRAGLVPALDIVVNVHRGFDAIGRADLEAEFLACYRRLVRGQRP
jgi:ribonuclease P protein component